MPYAHVVGHKTQQRRSHRTPARAREFQLGTVGSFVNHLFNANAAGESGVPAMIKKFNSSKTGFTIGVGDKSGFPVTTNKFGGGTFIVPFKRLFGAQN
ncbi:MAG: hypothetical protein EOP47_20570 [Sphingobacteriaceae bacterium]|nr:MAG: hypothetical protein EOP47_20570 [Sphingobacteriaceae bacterium]